MNEVAGKKKIRMYNVVWIKKEWDEGEVDDEAMSIREKRFILFYP